MRNYQPKEFAEIIGVSVKPLQRWDRETIWKGCRTPKGRRLSKETSTKIGKDDYLSEKTFEEIRKSEKINK